MASDAKPPIERTTGKQRSIHSPNRNYHTVSYTLTEQDLYEHYLFVNWTVPSRRVRVCLSYLILLGGMFWAFPSWLSLSQRLILGVAVAIAAIPLYFLFLRLRIRERIRDYPAIVGDETTAIFPEGLRAFSDLGEKQLKWSEITRVISTPKLILIEFDQEHTLIIPQRAFDSPEAALAYVEAAQSWLRAASTYASATKR